MLKAMNIKVEIEANHVLITLVISHNRVYTETNIVCIGELHLYTGHRDKVIFPL